MTTIHSRKIYVVMEVDYVAGDDSSFPTQLPNSYLSFESAKKACIDRLEICLKRDIEDVGEPLPYEWLKNSENPDAEPTELHYGSHELGGTITWVITETTLLP